MDLSKFNLRDADEWPGFNRRVIIAGHKFYVNVSVHPDGRLARLFLWAPKGGSTVSGFVHAYTQAVSDNLRLGESLEVLCDRYIGTLFEPLGTTNDPDIKEAKSVIDYIFRLVELKLLKQEEEPAAKAG